MIGNLGAAEMSRAHRKAVWNYWVFDREHAGFIAREIRLLCIALSACAHNVFPAALAPVTTGYDVVQSQLRDGEMLLTVLADIAVSQKYVGAAESNLLFAAIVATTVADHGGNIPGDRGRGNQLIIAGKGIDAFLVDKLNGELPAHRSDWQVP